MTFPSNEFARRVAIVTVTAVVTGVVLALVVLGADLFPLLFGAVLVALFLRGLSDWLSARTRLSPGLSLLAVVLALVGILATALALLAPAAIEQAREFVRSLPLFIENARQFLAGNPGGRELLEQMESTNGNGESWAPAVNVLALSLNGLVALIVVVFGGLYLAVDPSLYREGFVRLFPVQLRSRTNDVLLEMGHTLQQFLLGRVVSMVAVGAATWVGLSLIGIPLAAILGIVAGVLTFVPYAGPIVGAIPIGLVAITEGPQEFVIAMAVYTVIQSIEGFAITPLVQKKVVHLPPVLTLASEVLMGLVFGAIGVIISVPLAAALLVLVRMLWVEDMIEKPAALVEPSRGA